MIIKVLEESANVKIKLARKFSGHILQAAQMCIHCCNSGGKIVLFGNGGSAADAQHIAAELVGRFNLERQGIPAVALTTNTSILTALGNDYGFDATFARQVEAIVKENDVVIAISTTGKSKNVLDAIKKAKEKGAKTICLTGRDGGELAKMVDLAVIVPSNSVPRIQEAHITIGHIICELVEDGLFTKK